MTQLTLEQRSVKHKLDVFILNQCHDSRDKEHIANCIDSITDYDLRAINFLVGAMFTRIESMTPKQFNALADFLYNKWDTGLLPDCVVSDGRATFSNYLASIPEERLYNLYLNRPILKHRVLLTPVPSTYKECRNLMHALMGYVTRWKRDHFTIERL